MRMHELIKDAVEELREWAADNPGEDDVDGVIYDMVDRNVPIYDDDILDLAREEGLLYEPLEYEGATVIQGLSLAICQKLELALLEDWERIEEEREECEHET